MIVIFLFLYFVNLVLDFSFQTPFMSQYKSKSDYVLFVHCAIWGLGIWFALMPFGLFAWWKLFMLVGGHFIIDRWKCREHYKKWPLKTKHSHTNKSGDIYYDDVVTKEPVISDWMSLYIDQTLHAIQIFLCLL